MRLCFWGVAPALTTLSAGDPYYRFNDINYQWIAYSNWTYNRTFTVSASLFALDAVCPIRTVARHSWLADPAVGGGS